MGLLKRVLCGLLLLGGMSFASASQEAVFPYAQADLSLTYLNFLFGPLTGIGIYLQHNALSFAIVKILVFSIAFASFLGGWSVFLGTIRSSSEGKFLGEKLSQSSVILRSIVGLALLTPDGTGYAPIQRLFMSFILMGVALANNLWGILLDRYAKGDAILSSSAVATPTSNTLASQLMAQGVLMSYLINHADQILDFKVTLDNTRNYVQIQVLPKGGNSVDYSAPLVIYKTTGSPLDEALVPGIEQALRSFTYDSLAEIAAGQMAQLVVDDSATALTSSVMTTAYNAAGLDPDLRNALVNNSYNEFYALLAIENTAVAQDIQKYREDGWVIAGSLYWMLSQTFTPKNYSDNLLPASQATGVPTGAYVDVNAWLKAISSTFYSPTVLGAFNYTLSVTNAQGAYQLYAGSPNNYSSPATASVDAKMAGIDFYFTSLEDTFAQALSGKDPFLGFIKDCQSVLRGLLIFLISTLLTMVVLVLVATVFKNTQPMAHTIMVSFAMIAFLVLSFSFVIIPGAAFGGYYLPLVPMLIFTASVISWYLKVVEAIVAAPFVAVALLEPTQDDFGRGNASVLLLLHVMTKPALIMIGFILSSRLMIVALSIYSIPLNAFLNTTIFPATSSKIFYQKIMTMILVCDTTVAVVVALATRSFSLIYKVPDKVFGWIGHNAAGSEVSSIVGEVRSGAEQGIKMMSRIFEISVAAGKTVVEATKVAGSSSGGAGG